MGNGVRTRFIPADKAKKKYVLEFAPRGKEPHNGGPYMLIISYARIIHLHQENPFPTYEAAEACAKELEVSLMHKWQDRNQKLGQLPRVFIVAAVGVFFLTQDGTRGHERVAFEQINGLIPENRDDHPIEEIVNEERRSFYDGDTFEEEIASAGKD